MEDWMKFGRLSGDGGVLMTDCWAEIDPLSRRRDTTETNIVSDAEVNEHQEITQCQKETVEIYKYSTL